MIENILTLAQFPFLFGIYTLHELLDTEVKYCHDLTQCYEIFSQGLKDIINTDLASQLFLNFEQLISVSTSIANALEQLSPG
ncbi:unnamed protein product [Brugia timori]|uniref:DH domain-containing protein n=1 Tax=Brugia timori TaxID=42155 RepID=A0A0R3QZV3_9BILA|nr:unnamed protein product [Brugia timori]